jgi:hypothetical protein
MVAPIHGKKKWGCQANAGKSRLKPATLHFAYPIGNWRKGRFDGDRLWRKPAFFNHADDEVDR